MVMESEQELKERIEWDEKVLREVGNTECSDLTVKEISNHLSFLKNLEKSVFFNRKSLKILENNNKLGGLISYGR